MHKYLRAIGFSDIESIKDIEPIFKEIVAHPDNRIAVNANRDISYAQMGKEFGNGIGISMVGEMDETGQFFMEHYFPYVVPMAGDYLGPIEVEERLGNKSYAGISDNESFSLIYYITNIVELEKWFLGFKEAIAAVSLSALSTNGSILLPVAEPSGEDVFSLIETSIIPCGVECELYRVVGTIINYKTLSNSVTGESIYLMNLLCNEYGITLAINEKDLTGMPEKGRRFRGDIWLQGMLMLD
jgi:Glucose-6-phosphate isomerase